MPRLIDADALMESIGCADAVKYGNRDRAQQDISYSTMMLYEIRDEIDAQPTIGGWISVKDRLPEEHADEHPYAFEQYLCATVWNDVRMVAFGTRIGDDKQHFWSGNSIFDDRVTHWMPLPEPPKEVENETRN